MATALLHCKVIALLKPSNYRILVAADAVNQAGYHAPMIIIDTRDDAPSVSGARQYKEWLAGRTEVGTPAPPCLGASSWRDSVT